MPLLLELLEELLELLDELLEELLLELVELLLELVELLLDEELELDEEDELLELEEDEPVGSPPPHAAKVNTIRHELAIVTGRRQSTNAFIEDIFTYLLLVNTLLYKWGFCMTFVEPRTF